MRTQRPMRWLSERQYTFLVSGCRSKLTPVLLQPADITFLGGIICLVTIFPVAVSSRNILESLASQHEHHQTPRQSGKEPLRLLPGRHVHS